MLLPALQQARAKARTISCVGNLKQIALASIMYTQDNKERIVNGWYGTADYPGLTNDQRIWHSRLRPYYGDDKLLRCPSNTSDGVYCYGIFAPVQNTSLVSIKNASGTVLMGDNIELASEPGNSVPPSTWVRSNHGHWNMGYWHKYDSSAVQTGEWGKRLMNPLVHAPQVNLAFCDGHVASMSADSAWGPYNYGHANNIWDNQ
jgi:prepilin-type processing-associated H-X9-DG protein